MAEPANLKFEASLLRSNKEIRINNFFKPRGNQIMMDFSKSIIMASVPCDRDNLKYVCGRQFQISGLSKK
jgi:hypothetical protein